METAATPHTALVLFAHGARDPRWAEPLVRIRALIEAECDASVRVEQAFLELMSPDLPTLVEQLASQRISTVHIVPIFLGQGAHVRNDLPELVHNLSANFPHMQFSLKPAIGEDHHVLSAIAGVCMQHVAPK